MNLLGGLALETISFETASKSGEGSGGGRESDITEPDAVDFSGGTQHNFNSQLSVLKITGTHCDLNTIGVSHVPVDEHSHHRFIIGPESLLQGCANFSTVTLNIEVSGAEVSELHFGCS